ncbi:uncharacterized protein BX663DRAFT_20115 [Cokeromyces recurvatus]|uniref:uncharacterized protein n=1 Tax=Cokeromyces recurvatus TaxID=90255 RepID=UPI00221ECE8F|nr:uncharacterized protein BX663DRAFT_19751 [Cokeromyces recurvatus]XP_051388078.1 uncharacterized protein BX663DRAFT_20115 [Cokeromyces recurvatus]KAI7908082.1 hypothetical protein BX663DRAFT_19751 [Cokeromyces recurvatus]KAI7908093.1 hypothetical protein BX663DRAFT_20115 [Cokeromyces recurvatus]
MTDIAYYYCYKSNTNPFNFSKVSYLIHNFSDLCELLEINNLLPSHPHSLIQQSVQSTKYLVSKARSTYEKRPSLPKPIRYHSASTRLTEGLIFRAIQHWCCISFKVAPIELSLLQKKNTPRTILYCVAAISMITINEQQPTMISNGRQQPNNNTVNNKATEDFKRDSAYYFYKRACHYLEEFIFPDNEEEDLQLSIIAIQCYFCLSYTATLLRVTGEQHTWHYFASVLLKNKVKYADSSPILRNCWYRWYYIDAWLAISLNQECLLPDKIPFKIKEISAGINQNYHYDTTFPNFNHFTTPHHVAQQEPTRQHNHCCTSQDSYLQFAYFSQYMRKYNRAIQSYTLSSTYDSLTAEVKRWWDNQLNPSLHLKLCYYSMHLVVLFSLLQQDNYQVTINLLLEALDLTLKILQGLDEIKIMKCDLSTYHHMFFAIHQTLKAILFHIKRKKTFILYLEKFAKQQLIFNLCILESIDIFNHDLYQMKSMVSNMKSDLYNLGCLDNVATQSQQLVYVFRAEIPAKSAKSAKSAKKK